MSGERNAPLNLDAEAFRSLGHQLVDRLSDFFSELENKPVTTGESPEQIRALLPSGGLPEHGRDAAELLEQAYQLLSNHSLFNGHPKFFGYITSSAAPIGALADLLAAAMNPNVGAFILSPVATEMERQAIGWLADLIGLPPGYDGILVSGGNMANFTGFLAGRTAKAPEDLKERGLAGRAGKLLVYCSRATHTWIDKAAVLFGHGLEAVRWIPADEANRMDIRALKDTIEQDLEEGHQPFMAIGTAGDVSTGAVDNLREIAAVCRAYDLWFHIDGAYGIPAVALPELRELFRGMEAADSLALDPHKWLYAPLEAGCTLVRNGRHLVKTFTSHPDYYHFGQFEQEETRNFFEYGLQNSRGFRALKVWLGLQQVGREGFVKMIREDIALARLLYDLAGQHPELEAITHHLSISTLRYVPRAVPDGVEERGEYLNKLNRQLLDTLQAGGEVFPSNAVINGAFCLRFCIVNFRTGEQDIRDTVELVVREGRKLHRHQWVDTA